MTMTPQIASLRIARDLAVSELEIDRAVESSATLLATMVRARIETGATPETGQVAMMKIVRALSALTDARKDVIQTHSELRKIGETRADIVLPGECPNMLVTDESEAASIAA